MRRYLVVALLLLAPALSGPAPAAPPGDDEVAGVTLRGIVRDTGRTPLAGAAVVALCRVEPDTPPRRFGPVRTERDGTFALPGLPPGTACAVGVKAEGTCTWKVEEVRAPGFLEVELARCGAIEGRLVLGTGSGPVPAARISARRVRPLPPRTRDGVGDDRGRFVVEGLAPGTWDLLVEGKAAVPRTVPGIEVAPGARVDLGAVRLEPGWSLEGTVIEASSGNPVPGAAVSLFRGNILPGFLAPEGGRPVSSSTGGTTRTDDRGRFLFDGVPGGPVTILVDEGEPYVPAVVSLEIGDEGPAPVVVPLSTGRTVSGRVLSPEGRPVPGCEVSIRGLGVASRPVDATTAPDGTFRLEHVTVGPAQLVARPPGDRGLAPVRRWIEVPGSGQRAVEIRLPRPPPAVAVSGRILLDGDPVAGRAVFRRIDPSYGFPGQVIGETGSDDRYRVTLEPGSWQLGVVIDHGPGFLSLEVPRGSPAVTRDLEIPAGGLAGTVTGPDGLPAAGVEVIAIPTRDFFWKAVTMSYASGETDQDGRFRIGGLPPGRWWLAAAVFESSATLVGPFRVGDRVRGRVRLSLEEPVTVHLHVTDPAGHPLPYVSVVLLADRPGIPSAPLATWTTAEDGKTVASFVPPGDGWLVAWQPARGFAIERLPGALEDGDRVDLPVPRGVPVDLVVTAGGNPVPDATVTSLRPGNGPDLGITLFLGKLLFWRSSLPLADAAGRIRLPPLPAGSWEVTVRRGDLVGRKRFQVPAEGERIEVAIRAAARGGVP